mmetsp:Transcript_5947/g.7779  ORF Transcript_5947/g.7779 Transcript_5947/m.7779 type:complete len:83 (+) Transcript_5947:290-538(+)
MFSKFSSLQATVVKVTLEALVTSYFFMTRSSYKNPQKITKKKGGDPQIKQKATVHGGCRNGHLYRTWCSATHLITTKPTDIR